MHMRQAMMLWFCLAVLLEIGSSVALRWFLKRRGVYVSPMLYGVPGYLEWLYVRWCRTEGRVANVVVASRMLLLANAIAAAACFIVKVSERT